MFEHGEIVEISNSNKFNGLFGKINKHVPNQGHYQLSVSTADGVKHEILETADNLTMVFPTAYRQRIVYYFNHFIFNKCSVCDEQNLASEMECCPQCQSIFYCSLKCQTADNIKHSKLGGFCDAYKQFAKMEYEVINEMDRLFEFNNVMVLAHASDPFYEHYFLDEMKLNSEGTIWKRMCDCDEAPFGEYNLFKSENMNDTNYMLKFDENQIIQSELIIENWKDYYKIKNLSLESPIAHWMSYVMTVYYALTHYIKIRPIISNHKSEIVIHLVGAQVEIELMYLFQELLCLLPGYTFHIYLFGNNEKISERMDPSIIYHLREDCEFIQFYVFKSDYSNKTINQLVQCKGHRIPTIIIGLNAGISAGEYMKNCWQSQWDNCIRYAMKKEIPALFTEYFNHSIFLNEKRVKMVGVMEFVFGSIMLDIIALICVYAFTNTPNMTVLFIHVVLILLAALYIRNLIRKDIFTEKYVINPFRSPIINFNEQTRFSRVTNGFICGINI